MSFHIPRYSAGQWVYVRDRFDRTSDIERLCQVIYPFDNSQYLLRLIANDSYCVASEEQIDYDSEPPKLANVNEYRNKPVIFYGNAQFALPTLKMLVENGYNVVAVVTAPDNPHGRNGKPEMTAVKEYALSVGLTVMQPADLDSVRFRKRIAELNPSLGIVVEFRRIPQSVVALHPLGIINLHSSLLPAYRGASPITTAIAAGETLGGLTTILINDSIDHGPIINSVAVDITPFDNAGYLHLKLRAYGPHMVEDAMKRIYSGVQPTPQDDIVCDFLQPSNAPKIQRGDCLVNWLDTAENVYNFIRAHSPLPTAWTRLLPKGHSRCYNVKLFSVSRTGQPRGNRRPGDVFWYNRQLLVACSDELLTIEQLQLSGGKKLTALEFYNGHKAKCNGKFSLDLPTPCFISEGI